MKMDAAFRLGWVSSLFGMTRATFWLAIAACLTFFVLPAEHAHAQPGSRLCGYIMKGSDGGFTGYLYEAREASINYDKDCAFNADAMYGKYIEKGYIASFDLPGTRIGADCHQLPSSHGDWHRHCQSTCEDVGQNFQSSNSPKDMCDKMEADKNYEVVFDPVSNTTTYKKI